MRKTLEDLFYGKIAPIDKNYYYHPVYQKYVDIMKPIEEKLRHNLTTDEKRLLEEYINSYDNVNLFMQCEAFKDGFSFALRLVFDSLQPSIPKN